MSESEQAQAITPQQFHEAMQYVWGALPNKQACQIKCFVDSQAQRIAEQAAETERLTKERNDARKLAEDSRDDEYDNDMDLSVAENRAARREYAKNHPLPWEKQ